MNVLTSAVAAVVADPAGRVLLCQQSQGHQLWGLPGGRIRTGESPVHAAVRDIRLQTGTEVEIVDLVGLYTLTGHDEELPDVLVHAFRARLDGEVSLNAPGQFSRLAWFDPASLPAPVTATARQALTDAAAGRSGVLRMVTRAGEPAPRDTGDDPGTAPATLADPRVTAPATLR